MADEKVFPCRGKACNKPEAEPVKSGNAVITLYDSDPVTMSDILLYTLLKESGLWDHLMAKESNT